MAKTVVIKINGGKVSADFSGFTGNSCEKLSQRIALPQFEETEKELKPEYYQQDTNIQSETNQW